MASGALIVLSPGFAAGEEDTTCLPYIQMFLKAMRTSYPELQIHLISFQYPFTASVYDWHGVKVYAMAGRNKKWNRLVTWKKVSRQIDAICSANRVSGILSLWLTECTYIAQKAAKKHGISMIAWSWGQDVKKTNRYIKRLDFSLFDVACVSPFSAEQLLLNHGIKNVTVIENGLYPAGIPSFRIQPQQYDIVSAGSFSDFKQFDWVVDAVHALKEEFPAIKACMIGTGPEWEKVHRKTDELNLSAHIELKGNLPHAGCLNLMMQSKLLLHPSSFEGASTVILEALYYGCYVISSTVPASGMPPVFFRIGTKEELIRKAKEVMRMERNTRSFCVATSEESAAKIMRLFGYKS